ncbi:hypothetical protein [Bosea rubneri]|uniref:DUF3987 domain-containing protein n=1 Tax=Bosea rubneri TaxID=3075434 RepID=A0ABU3SFW9_9HYPH|nr:hypothetical protein [Bosea sp. ZW T0_25]MDU0343693.1 hypothetical protein [Bosea sp. ZW T0_25]
MNMPAIDLTALRAERNAAVMRGDVAAQVRIERLMTGAPEPAAEPANDNIPMPEASADGLPAELCYPPGFVGDMARFIVSASRFPSPPLAMVSALALTAALAGRRYKGPTGLRTNIYLVGLAESGMGKDLTLRAPRIVAGAGPNGAKIAETFLDADPASPEGLAARLRKHPSVLASIDEFGKWLAERTSRNAATHKAGIVSAMMRLTGAASGAWAGAEKSAGKDATVLAPCFSIHGVTTPSTFWAALGAGNISEGLLGRLIVIDGGTRLPAKVRRPADIEDVPRKSSRRLTMQSVPRLPAPIPRCGQC